MPNEPVFEFAQFRLDPARRSLTRGDGESLPLAPRAFDALLLMVARPGELIGKTTLMNALWPKVIVSDNSLDQIISRLRRALENAGDPPLIATERGRGYRFVGAVKSALVDHAFDAEVTRPGGTRDAYARALYLQGRALGSRPSADNVRAASELFRRAFARDTRFAQALAHLANTRIVLIEYRLTDPGELDVAAGEARAALDIAPGVAQAHLTLARVSSLRGEWDALQEHLDAATHGQTDLESRLARLLALPRGVGYRRLALEQSISLDELFPAQPLGAMAAALASAYLDLDEQTAHYLDIAEALGFPSDHTQMRDLRALLALRAGRFAEVKAHVMSGLSSSFIAAGGAEALARACEAVEHPALRSEAAAALRHAARRIPEPNLGLTEWNRLIEFFVMLGALDDAYRLLDSALERLAPHRIVAVVGSGAWTREFQDFRKDPRFQQLVRRTRLTEYWAQHGAPDGCELRDGTLVER